MSGRGRQFQADLTAYDVLAGLRVPGATLLVGPFTSFHFVEVYFEPGDRAIWRGGIFCSQTAARRLEKFA